jgi:hypothetical protein
MTTAEHLTSQELRELIAGRMETVESARLLAHIEQCDHCLAQADELWSQQPVAAVVADWVELDAPTAQRLERQLVRKIHRSNLSADMLRLGTQGFLSVAVSLLRPIVRPRRP